MNRRGFDAWRRWFRKLQAPEMGRRCQELDADALPALAEIAQEDDPALDLFLSFRVADGQQFAVVHFVLERKKAAVRADHQGLARFAEFFAIVSASLRLQLDLAKDAGAAPGSGKLDGGHSAFIMENAKVGVNCTGGQMYRIGNGP